MNQAIANDPIDLSHLPYKVAIKARRVIKAIQEGINWFQLGGKQFHFNRNLISIPVTYRYRLLCRREKSEIIFLKVLSHEAYNHVARNKV